LKQWAAKGACSIVHHKGVDMVCFQRLKVGQRESVADAQQVKRQKHVQEGSFGMLGDMMDNLGWSIVGGGGSGQPEALRPSSLHNRLYIMVKSTRSFVCDGEVQP